MKKTAKKIKDIKEWKGDAKLFELSEEVEYDEPWDENDPPASKTKFVVVSAVNALFSGPETYIFPSDEEGEILDWGALTGSYRGGFSHQEALKGAGFEIVE